MGSLRPARYSRRKCQKKPAGDLKSQNIEIGIRLADLHNSGLPELSVEAEQDRSEHAHSYPFSTASPRPCPRVVPTYSFHVLGGDGGESNSINVNVRDFSGTEAISTMPGKGQGTKNGGRLGDRAYRN